MNNLVVKLFVYFLFLVVAMPVNSEEIKVVTEEFPPYNYTEEGSLKGLSTEVLNAVLKKVNIKPTIKVYPWARAYKIAQRESNVLIFSIAMSKEREKMFQRVGVVAPVRTCLFSLSSNRIKLNRLDDAKKHRVITQLNGHTAQVLVEHGFENGKNLITSTSTENAFKMLESGRSELLGYPELVVYHILRKKGKSPKNLVSKELCFDKVTELYLAFSLKTPKDIVERFREGLEAIKNEGTHQKILEKYFN